MPRRTTQVQTRRVLRALSTRTTPELPRVQVDTTMPSTAGYVTYTVKASGGDFTSLNTAVNSTSPAVKTATTGIILTVDAGYTMTEAVTLPVHTNPWVIIQSSGIASLPAGTRVAPGDATHMAKIQQTTGPTLMNALGAHHYRLIGIEVALTAPVGGSNVVLLGNTTATTNADLPSYIVIDRCYVHGTTTDPSRRGLLFDVANGAIIESYISAIHDTATGDTQAILIYNTLGPVKIQNNYIEAAGENFEIGGVDSSITNNIPADIEFRGNLCFKPKSWDVNGGVYGGVHWEVKNSFEIKQGLRVLVENNTFQNNWPDSQDGRSFLLTLRNNDNLGVWNTIRDITIRTNVFQDCFSAFGFLAADDHDPTNAPTPLAMQRVLVQDNVCYGLGVDYAGSFPLFLSLSGNLTQGSDYVTVDHNTAFAGGHPLLIINPPTHAHFVFTNNMMLYGSVGITGDVTNTWTDTITSYLPGSTTSKNVVIGSMLGSPLPAGNFNAADTTAVGFVDYAGGDYHLTSGSAYHNAGTDGTDIGARF